MLHAATRSLIRSQLGAWRSACLRHRRFATVRGGDKWTHDDVPEEVLQMTTIKEFIKYAMKGGATVRWTNNGHMRLEKNGEYDTFSGWGRLGQLHGQVRKSHIEFFLRAGIIPPRSSREEEEKEIERASTAASDVAPDGMMSIDEYIETMDSYAQYHETREADLSDKVAAAEVRAADAEERAAAAEAQVSPESPALSAAQIQAANLDIELHRERKEKAELEEQLRSLEVPPLTWGAVVEGLEGSRVVFAPGRGRKGGKDCGLGSRQTAVSEGWEGLAIARAAPCVEGYC